MQCRAAFLVSTCLVVSLRAQRVAEVAEPNASPATATVLELGREAFGTLATAADSDWFRVVLTAPSDLCLDTAPGTGTEVGDTTLVLLDATGAPLRANEQGVGSGHYARLWANA